MPSGLLNPMQPTSPLTPLEPPIPPSSTLLPPLLIWRENVALALSLYAMSLSFCRKKQHLEWLHIGWLYFECTYCTHILRTGELRQIIVEEKVD